MLETSNKIIKGAFFTSALKIYLAAQISTISISTKPRDHALDEASG